MAATPPTSLKRHRPAQSKKDMSALLRSGGMETAPTVNEAKLFDGVHYHEMAQISLSRWAFRHTDHAIHLGPLHRFVHVRLCGS
jgi:hypothetical protein